jgi:hypothetical protein
MLSVGTFKWFHETDKKVGLNIGMRFTTNSINKMRLGNIKVLALKKVQYFYMRLLATIINSRNRLLIGLLRRLWTIDFSV